MGGASIAYHLAQRAETDVVLLERAELTSGSTFHSAGLVGQLRADPALTRMNMYSVDLYRRLQRSADPPGWVESGGIKLASSADRLVEIRRQVGWASTYGLPLHEISAAEAADRFPPLDTDGVVGAAYLESDGSVDPSQLCHSLAAGARRAGVRICQHTRVVAIDTVETSAGRAVSRVRTDRGDIECEVVVDAGGIYAAEIARMVGVRLPIVAMAHQYAVTDSLPGGEDRVGVERLPTLRDPDLLVYWRAEGAGLLMGGYERDPEPWRVSPTAYDDVPADFNATLLAPDWPRFEPLVENAARRVPLMADLGLRTLVNGPEAFTPDNEFCLGETEVAGFHVAAGFCAHGIAGAGGIGLMVAEWILDGEPSLDLWHMDVSRFGAAYRSPGYTLARTVESYQRYYDIAFPGREREAGRPLRTSPVYAWHRAHGAYLGEKAGWERVNWYAENATLGEERLRPRGWAGREWSPAIGAEHRATREGVGLFDETSFAKLHVHGPDGGRFLDWVCDNAVARRPGDVTYTQALDESGGIVCDVTVTRRAEHDFLVVTGTAFGGHDAGWLRKRARLDGYRVAIDDVTGSLACFALWGPRAHAVLQPLCPLDVSEQAFPFMTAQNLTVGDVPLMALRVSFVGEAGWELYASTEYAGQLWDTLVAAGRPEGLLPCGYRALDTLRLERGYRVWGADLTPETNPLEAGLGFCVRFDKPGGFVGADALRAIETRGVERRLVCLSLDDPQAVALGLEPVRAGGAVLGRVTSAGYGYTVGRSLAYAYLPVDSARRGTRVTVDLSGEQVGATVVTRRDLLPAADA